MDFNSIDIQDNDHLSIREACREMIETKLNEDFRSYNFFSDYTVKLIWTDETQTYCKIVLNSPATSKIQSMLFLMISNYYDLLQSMNCKFVLPINTLALGKTLHVPTSLKRIKTAARYIKFVIDAHTHVHPDEHVNLNLVITRDTIHFPLNRRFNIWSESEVKHEIKFTEGLIYELSQMMTEDELYNLYVRADAISTKNFSTCKLVEFPENIRTAQRLQQVMR